MKRTLCTTGALLAASLALALCERTTAVETMTMPQPLDLRHVALFKNGLGFFVGRFECPDGQTSFDVALPTAPSHGTFWVSYSSDLPLGGIVARQVESGQTLEAVTIFEMLKANPGRKVRLTVGDKEITGAIRYLAQNREPPRPDPYRPGGRGAEATGYRPWEPYNAGLVVMETEAGEVSLDPRTVTQVTFLDGKAQRRFVERGKSIALHVQLKAPARGQKLTISYLGKGITWAPSYVVDITDGAKAHLSAKALIINDACEMKEVAAQLVTGFPHLQFADVMSPIAMKEDLAQFLQALSRGQSERGRPDTMSNVMSQAVLYRDQAGPAPMPAYGAAEAGQVAEDLFLYPAGQIDLAKGEVAYIPLFTETVPSKHIYQWSIPDYISADGRNQYRGEQADDSRERQEVWHGIRLTNTTKVPWTTAPGETVKNGVILGQDTLSYTPPAGEITLRITQAVGIKAEQREFETARQRDAAQMYGYRYDLVTVRGELSVVNFQDKTVDLEITKTLSGELKSAEPDAKIEKLATGLRGMNARVQLTWTLELKPGEKASLSYLNELYIRP